MVKIEKNWYFEKLKTKFNYNYTERYYLTAINKNTDVEGTLIAFLMNPSHAGRHKLEEKYEFSSEESDVTVNLILRTIGIKYKNVVIINSFSHICSVSTTVQDKINELKEAKCKKQKYNKLDCRLKINEERIKKFIKTNYSEYDLFIGTGQLAHVNSSYRKIMSFLTKYNKGLSTVFLSSINSNRFSAHPKPLKAPIEMCEYVLKQNRKAKIEGPYYKPNIK
ncbi:hypothetical protein [Leuconostoc sp.]|uniref:hypothetical protein n=1 Tax=Leuconostoc sp. TaxID=1930076 RepID=UPI002958A5B5|nr:hypothetical protein [Leuconostoc sp.]MDV8935367.1 hypothetical protein [Leuconostoc sp.]